MSQSLAELQATAQELQATLDVARRQMPEPDASLSVIAFGRIGDWGFEAQQSAREELANREALQRYIEKLETRLQQVHGAIASQERRDRRKARLIAFWRRLFGSEQSPE